jgi:hypothetical protein
MTKGLADRGRTPRQRLQVRADLLDAKASHNASNSAADVCLLDGWRCDRTENLKTTGEDTWLLSHDGLPLGYATARELPDLLRKYWVPAVREFLTANPPVP